MKYQGLLVTQLSGKAGGVVAARNKAGGYLRSFVVPTNPNTALQSRARSRFSGSFGAWHGLTDAQKNQWNMFAVTDYRPQRGAIPGVTYSGAQAFTGLRNTAFAAEDYRDSSGLISTPAVTATYATFSMPFVAPSAPFAGISGDGLGNPLAMQMISATLSAAGALTFTVEFNGGITVAAAPNFIDVVSGDGIGFAVYGSLPAVQAQSFKPNPGFTLLSALGAPNISSGWVSGTSMTVGLAVPSGRISQHKLWYSSGDLVKLTLFAVAKSWGIGVPLGSVEIAVS